MSFISCSFKLFEFSNDAEYLPLEKIAEIGTGISNTNEAVDDPNETLDNQLVLTVSGGQLVGTLSHDFTDGSDSSNWTVVEDVSLNAKATDTYNVRIDFFNLDANQDNNQGDHFAGHFDVSQKVVTSNAG